jgi:nucleoside phosphorylase
VLEDGDVLLDTPPTEVLVVAATRVEARYVPTRFPVLITGIGKIAAAAAVATRIAQDHPRIVLNLGTAGALRDEVQGLLLPSAVVNHDISAEALEILGFPVRTRLEIPGGDGTVLASGDVFVADAGARDRLAERADAVDMEGFAVAWACEQAGVPCRLVKHVSDSANEASLDWPSLVDASARVLGAWLEAVYPPEHVQG